MPATPCTACGYPASGGPHTPPDACITHLLRSLAARDLALRDCRDHIAGLQRLMRSERAA